MPKPKTHDAAAPTAAVVAVEGMAPAIAPAATPENTPLPGGGRWRWDDEAAAWASLDPQPVPKAHGEPAPDAPRNDPAE